MKKLLLILIVFCIFTGPYAWAIPIPNSEIQAFGTIGFWYPTYGDPANTIDDNIDTYWSSEIVNATNVLAYNFIVPYSISQIDFYSLPDKNPPNYFMGELYIQVSQNSTDGFDGDWTTVDYVPSNFIPGDIYFSRYPNIQDTKWVRLWMEYGGVVGTFGFDFYLNEIDFYDNATSVPDASVMLLLGTSLFGLVGFSRKSKRS